MIDKLKTNLNCSYCNSSNITVVNSYKHHWISCNDCNNVKRIRKDKYFFDKKIFKSVIYRTQNWNICEAILPKQEVINEETKYYDYYFDTAKKGIQGTKWEKVVNDTLKKLIDLKIDLNNKTVLDISGGPGFLTAEIKKQAKKAILTEFSQLAVDGMAKALNIDAVKYDYNTDKLEEVIKEKIDVVLIIYSIGFCNNLPDFLSSLKKVLHKDSVVYIAYSPPTLGLMLRWQFDEYTYNMCYTYESMRRCFAEIGMFETYAEDMGSYAYDRGTSGILKKVSNVYLRKALNKTNNINRELIQKNLLQVYKFKEI